MNYKFLVTTDINAVPVDRQIVMIDGTVPGWTPKPGDLHFDHHKPCGEDVQIMEIPTDLSVDPDAVFVTTQVDADAICSAVAIMLLSQGKREEFNRNYEKLVAISYDCDHLRCPYSLDHLSEFARNVVAGLKASSDKLVKDLSLPPQRNLWSPQQRSIFHTEAFRRGIESIWESCVYGSPWVGSQGEAIDYWKKQASIRPVVEENCMIALGSLVFRQDFCGNVGYIDPRLANDVAMSFASLGDMDYPIILKVCKPERLPGFGIIPETIKSFSYILGSISSPGFKKTSYSDNGVWEALAEAESISRSKLSIPQGETNWGGRNAVGGSGWNDPSILYPLDAIQIARGLTQKLY